jgi:hypothetical protein
VRCRYDPSPSGIVTSSCLLFQRLTRTRVSNDTPRGHPSQPLRAIALLLVSAGLASGCGESQTDTRPSGGDRAHQEPSSTRQTTKEKDNGDQDPAKKEFGPSAPCESVSFDPPPFSASDIQVAGAIDCNQAQSLVRRAHGPCASDSCEINGFSCRVEYAGTQQLSVRCTGATSEVKWGWVGGF